MGVGARLTAVEKQSSRLVRAEPGAGPGRTLIGLMRLEFRMPPGRDLGTLGQFPIGLRDPGRGHQPRVGQRPFDSHVANAQPQGNSLQRMLRILGFEPHTRSEPPDVFRWLKKIDEGRYGLFAMSLLWSATS